MANSATDALGGPVSGTPSDVEVLVPDLLELVQTAGQAILEVYADLSTAEVTLKADRSPVTKADMASHRVLVDGLHRLTPDVPVISEESLACPWEERQHWSSFWLIDPLDGTKEFLHRNGEFTVNIAYIAEGRPILGLVGVPVHDEYYVGSPSGAFFLSSHQGPRQVLRAGDYAPTVPIRVAVSRSHPSTAVQEMLARLDSPQCIPVGSSLKLCLLARGEIDLYPRLGPIMEWDIAAAHAVVEASGAVIRSSEDQPIVYNSESLYAPWFIARRNGVVIP